MNRDRGRRASPGALYAALAVWLVASVAIGASGLLARSPVPPPAIAVGLTVLLLLVVLLVPAVAEQVRSVGARKLVAFHVLRLFAGINFLVLASRGILPDEFAVAAGWGDIAVGATAILVCWWCFPLRTAAQRRTLLLWNAFGLVDILGVLANGIRLFVRDPTLAEPFTRLPTATLPTFVVPIVIASHILLFAWRRDLLRPSDDAERV
jgi:hypothetical protein